MLENTNLALETFHYRGKSSYRLNGVSSWCQESEPPWLFTTRVQPLGTLEISVHQLRVHQHSFGNFPRNPKWKKANLLVVLYKKFRNQHKHTQHNDEGISSGNNECLKVNTFLEQEMLQCLNKTITYSCCYIFYAKIVNPLDDGFTIVTRIQLLGTMKVSHFNINQFYI